MTRKEKIAAIYKEMANKELTPGCCVEVKAQNEYGDFTYRLCRGDERPTTEIKEIIGHPVMIGDALEVLDAIATNRNNARYERRLRDILMVWNKPRKPIDEQPDECIDFVYSLIQKN